MSNDYGKILLDYLKTPSRIIAGAAIASDGVALLAKHPYVGIVGFALTISTFHFNCFLEDLKDAYDTGKNIKITLLPYNIYFISTY
ncbi:MAG: hypothetical protein A2Y17_01500 [Clostridiales bacterium GWF2_38_85]|nr:MAG: hypothetical protein A2Y17_01500 [Clostridiales bacterium GWF2_38_85]HBL84816.1 hypothetical protein [Clostridiales bacterium]